jgi:N-methylhydantoinase A
MPCIIGVDTGGTFTDVVVIEQDGRTISAKAATTPADLAVGVVNAVKLAAAQLDLSLEQLLGQASSFRLSGTTVTNVLITRQGAAAGLITTAGFEDTLHIGRASSTWAGVSEEEVRHVYRRTKPEPLVPKRLVRGIAERIDSSGRVVVPLRRSEIVTAARELVEGGARSLAVAFLWSIRNPAHELEAADIIRVEHPDVSLHLSHAVAPALGESERFATTAIDALAGPVMKRFLTGVRSTLEAAGFEGELIVAQADGGAVYAEETQPVSTLQSGPAAGVIASRNEGRTIGMSNIVTADVGGTSFDVAVVADGAWQYAREPVAERFFLSVPMIEVESVGAGGGSIAWVDELDVLHVGPRSAGAQPGPACYGQGGTEATVTDAALVLGYVNPQYFLGGRVKLVPEAAERAIGELGDALGLSLFETAAGIFEIANSHMAGLVTARVLSRGYDPRDFVVFAYGGAGGMHGAFYAEEASIPEVVVPALAGTFSALGVATAPLLHTRLRHDFFRIPMSDNRFRENFRALEEEVVARLERDGVSEADRAITYTLEMRYGAQVHTVQLDITRDAYLEADFDRIGLEFDLSYDKLYGQGSGYADAGRFVTGFIVKGYGQLPVPDRRPATHHAHDPSAAHAGTRPAFFGESLHETAIYRYDDLRAGNEIEGPAVIEAAGTTIVVPPSRRASVDPYLNVRIQTGATNGGVSVA